MCGENESTLIMFCYVSLETVFSKDHPLRLFKNIYYLLFFLISSKVHQYGPSRDRLSRQLNGAASLQSWGHAHHEDR